MASKNDETVLGVDLSERSLKLFQRNVHSNEADLVHVEPLSPAEFDSEGYLPGVLKRLLSMYQGHIRTRRIVAALPASMTFTRVVEIDSAIADIGGQILWEIEQQSIGRTGRQIFDFMEIPAVSGPDTEIPIEQISDDTLDSETFALPEAKAPVSERPSVNASAHFSRYLVTAMDEDRLRRIESILKKARFAPSVIDVDLFALVNIFNFSYPEDKNDLAGIADLRPDGATVLLTRNGQYLDHEFLRGLDFTRPESLASAVERIEGAVFAQAGLAGDPLKKIMLCGELLADPQARDVLLPAFKQTVEVMDPLKKIGMAAEIAGKITKIAPALAVVAGLTLRTSTEDEDA